MGVDGGEWVFGVEGFGDRAGVGCAVSQNLFCDGE
jgi:hypothetical protein